MDRDVFEAAIVAAMERADSAEDLNEALLRAESALAELRMGVSASVQVRPPGPAPGGARILYAKKGGKWRILWAGPGDGKKPIPEMSLAERSETAKRLVELLEAMILEAERQIAEVRAATSKLEEFLTAFTRA